METLFRLTLEKGIMSTDMSTGLTNLTNLALNSAAATHSESESSCEQAVSHLTKLLDVQVSTALLLRTGAGRSVRKLAKHQVASIAQAAGKVVAQWKEVVKKEEAKSAANNPTQSTSDAPPAKRQRSGPTPSATTAALETLNSSQLSGSQLGGSQPSGSQPNSSLPSTSQHNGHNSRKPLVVVKTGDAVRDRTRELLAEALMLAVEDVPGANVGAVATAVEMGMYAQNKGVNPKYKAKYRSLAFNLKDKKNPDLRRRVLSGEVAPERLCEMSNEELASDSRKDENAKIRETALFEAERSMSKVATTDAFKCGKCKQNKCTYYQMQTRSADEPMTTFVTCMNCNNRWKFC